MAAPPSAYKDRHFLAVIGDEVRIEAVDHPDQLLTGWQDSVTGLLLAGIGVSRLIHLQHRSRLIQPTSMSLSHLMPRKTS